MWGKRNDMVVHRNEPYNAEPSRPALARDHVTPIDTFYVRNHGAVPTLDPLAWRICVNGLVGSPLELDLDQIKGNFQHRTLMATLQCAGNRRAALAQLHPIPGEDPWGSCATSTGRWTGVRLADVLRAACLDEQASKHVEFIAADESDTAVPPQPYGSSIPIRKALSSEVLLAWQLNGQDLPAVHGGPLRVVVPGYIGARSVKWVQRLTALREPSSNYYQDTAYRLLPAGGTPGPGAGVSLGPVALNSDVLLPADGVTVPAGGVEVRGYAYTGDGRGIAAVQVSLDDGQTWVPADLNDDWGPWAWRLWSTRLHLPEGSVRISVRAWDTSGATQPESAHRVWNSKGYANNSWGCARITASP
jgi:sulfite oxidase